MFLRHDESKGLYRGKKQRGYVLPPNLMGFGVAGIVSLGNLHPYLGIVDKEKSFKGRGSV